MKIITHLSVKILNYKEIDYPEFSRISIDGGALSIEEARTKLINQNEDGYHGYIIGKVYNNSDYAKEILLDNYEF